MGLFPRWLTATRHRPGPASWRSVLAGVILFALALLASGLLISSLVASAAPAHAGIVQVDALPSHPPKPTPTPHGPPATDTPDSTPSATIPPNPTPPATVAPTPPAPTTGVPAPTATPPAAMATVAPTPTATRTANPGAGRGASAGSGSDSAPAADGPPGLLVLGLAALALLAFGVFMLLEARHVPRKEQTSTLPAAAQKAAPARLNQRQQVLPVQKAAPQWLAEDAAKQPQEQGETRKPLLPQHETPPAPLKPPRWLIDAGLLKEEQWDLPAEDSREL